MPYAYHKKSKHNSQAGVVKRLPEMGSNHRYKKSGEKQGDGGEYSALPLPVFLAVSFQDFIDNSIPPGLHREISRPARMRVIRMKKGESAIQMRAQLFIVVGPFLRIAEDPISL